MGCRTQGCSRCKSTERTTGNPRRNFLGLPSWSYATATVKTERLEKGKILPTKFLNFFTKFDQPFVYCEDESKRPAKSLLISTDLLHYQIRD